MKRKIGYVSLKSQYLRQFTSLHAENSSIMEQRLPGEDEEEDILPSNPIERIDAKIAELADSVVDMNILKENVVKLKAELKLAVKTANIANAKVTFARKVTEERLKECLPVPSFEDEHSKVLETLMSSLLDEDSIENVPETEALKPREDFLKDIEDSFEMHREDNVIKERLKDVKNKLLDKVKSASVRNRRMSISSTTSSLDRKRKGSTELPNEPVRSKPSPVSPQS